MTRNELITAILENLNLTKRAMSGQMQLVTNNLSISPAQLAILYIIRQLQPVSTKILAQEQRLTPGAISQLTDVLVNRNLVVREPDDTDRRTHMLRTTKTGDKLLHTIQKRRDELFKRVMHNFSEEELKVWLRVQKKVIRELEAEKASMATSSTTTTKNK